MPAMGFSLGWRATFSSTLSPSVISMGSLATASTSSGTPRMPPLSSRKGLNCSMNRPRMCFRLTSATSKPGSSTLPTPSKVTRALTISTSSTGKYMPCSAPRARDMRMSWPRENSSNVAARFQRLAMSAASRRNPSGSAAGPGRAMAVR